MRIAGSHALATKGGTGRSVEEAHADFARMSYSGQLIASERSGKVIELS